MGAGSPIDLSAVPVFPLPGVVLLPTAVLPLHIFEERYREMTRVALAGDGLIAMALLADGWQQDYYGKPRIEEAVCVGQIVSHEMLPDGKYNFLLQGRLRAKAIREVETDDLFRRFELQPIEETSTDESQLLPFRQSFSDTFEAGFLAGTTVSHTFVKLLNSAMPTSQLADLIAFTCFDDAAVKQKLLAESDVRQRVEAVTEYLQEMRPPPPWPPTSAYKNPSAN